MRTYRNSATGLVIEYPSLIAFAFSQMPVRISGADLGDAVTVTLTYEGSSISERRVAGADGSLIIDICRLAQLVFPWLGVGPRQYDTITGLRFVGMSAASMLFAANAGNRLIAVQGKVGSGSTVQAPLGVDMTLTVEVGSDSATDDLTVIWGAMDYDAKEDFNRTHVLRYWEGYPWTMPVWKGAATLSLSNGTTASSGFSALASLDGFEGWVQASRGYIEARFGGSAAISAVFEQGGVISASNAPQNEDNDSGEAKYRIIPTCAQKAKEHVYLRWLTRTGDIGYYLLDRSERNQNSSVYMQSLRAITDVEEPDDRGLLPSVDWRTKQTAEVISAGVQFAGEDDYATLCDLMQSPLVEMYHKNDDGTIWWEKVNITAGSLPRQAGRGHRLQAIDVVIERPTRRVVAVW